MSSNLFETTVTFDFADKTLMLHPLTFKVKKEKSIVNSNAKQNFNEINRPPIKYIFDSNNIRNVESDILNYLEQNNLELDSYDWAGRRIDYLEDLLKIIGDDKILSTITIFTYKKTITAEEFLTLYLNPKRDNDMTTYIINMKYVKPVSTIEGGYTPGLIDNYNNLSEIEKERLKILIKKNLNLWTKYKDEHYIDDNNVIYFDELISNLGEIIYLPKVQIYALNDKLVFLIESLFETACEAYIEIKAREGIDINKKNCIDFIANTEQGEDNMEFINLVFGDAYNQDGSLKSRKHELLSNPKFVELQNKYMELLLRKFPKEQMIKEHNLRAIEDLGASRKTLDYKNKYLKYKNKYLELKKMSKK
jgi:hypothetical protein